MGWKVQIKKSTRKEKKYMAIFTNSDTDRTKTVHFGAKGYSDFTQHKDNERKQRYIERHRGKEDWNNPFTAGSLSRWILWNKPSLKASISAFKKKFRM